MITPICHRTGDHPSRIRGYAHADSILRQRLACNERDSICEEVMMKRNYARLTRPLVRKNGELTPTTWDEALEVAAAGLGRYGGESFGMFSCSKATNETNYIAQNWARLVMASNNLDRCNRT